MKHTFWKTTLFFSEDKKVHNLTYNNGAHVTQVVTSLQFSL